MPRATQPRIVPDSTPPIRVLLVEDHEHVLWGLGKLIEGEWPRMVVAGTARTASEALDALRARPVDVVVLDVFLGRENSLQHLPAQIAACGAALVVLTGDPDPALHRLALQSGAHAVLLKEGPAEVLLREIERAMARQRNCPSAVGTGTAGSVS
jgi:two-component system nitrate/nitrite response regulator NarL